MNRTLLTALVIAVVVACTASQGDRCRRDNDCPSTHCCAGIPFPFRRRTCEPLGQENDRCGVTRCDCASGFTCEPGRFSFGLGLRGRCQPST